MLNLLEGSNPSLSARLFQADAALSTSVLYLVRRAASETSGHEVWTYEATGTAEEGQYANVATVTGSAGDELDTALTDSDPSHYFGLVASIDIVKTPDVAVVDIGAPHTFTITVTNTSNVDLTGVVVTDPVVPACDREIGAMTPGQVVTYTCDVSEVFTHINNIASVEGVAPDGTLVTDEDAAEVTVIGEGGGMRDR